MNRTPLSALSRATKPGDTEMDVWLEEDGVPRYHVAVQSIRQSRRRGFKITIGDVKCFAYEVEFYADPDNEDAEPEVISAAEVSRPTLHEAVEAAWSLVEKHQERRTKKGQTK